MRSRIKLASAFLALMFIIITLAGCQRGAVVTPTAIEEVTPTTEVTNGIAAPEPESTPTPWPTMEPPSEVPEELRVVWEVWNVLIREHVDRLNLDPAVLSEAAVRGMIDALDDPHTAYITPQSFQITNSDIFGSFEGIGAHVQMTMDGRLMIISPLPGTPAEAAGLKPGDVILEVDGESIEGLSITEAVMMIRGPRGSKVKLLIKHLLSPEPEIVEIIRQSIAISSVRMSITEDKFAHIRLLSFNADTPEDFKKELTKAEEEGVRGIVLDLRDNPGGLLRETVDLVSEFLEEGLVLYEIDGSRDRKDWRARKGGMAVDIPLVVLVNERSASGSEVVVGALQDHKRAKIIGETTFGKGSVNILRALSNGGGLYLTIARFYTPLGRLIEGEGLEPDIYVKTPTDISRQGDTQFNKAVEVLKEGIGVLVP